MALRSAAPLALRTGPSYADVHGGCPVQAAFFSWSESRFFRLDFQVASQDSANSVPRAASKRDEKAPLATSRRSIFLPSFLIALDGGTGSLSETCVHPYQYIALQRVAESTILF